MILVHCARVPATLQEGRVAELLRTLPQSRRANLARRLAAGDSGRESLAGLALLVGFSRRKRVPPMADLRWTRRGKPYFPDGPEFSIAHSGGLAVCAIAPKGMVIGVDIEPDGRARAEAIRLVAHDDERGEVSRGVHSATGLWTCKEAVLKAAGGGLPDIRRVRIAGDRATFDGAVYHLLRRKLAERFLLAIATSRPAALGKLFWPSRLL